MVKDQLITVRAIQYLQFEGYVSIQRYSTHVTRTIQIAHQSNPPVDGYIIILLLNITQTTQGWF